MIKTKDKHHSIWIFYLISTIVYCCITLLIFQHRLPHITTEFGMPDVDTDGGLWYQWYLYYTKTHNLLPQITTLFVYPFGFDLTFVPFSNLIYSTQLFFLEHILGFSWSNLVLVTNISSLVTYPLSALGASFLCYYITKNKWGAFMAGCVYAFSFYHVYMGRGQMSINHIEFIPFYLLSLLYFLDKKNIASLLISAIIFTLTFNADPYYAFFSGIFSVVICAFYRNDKIIKRIATGLIYYTGLFIVLVLTSLNFVLSNLYLFDKTQLAQSGRNSMPRNELVNILYYFSKTAVDDISYLYQFLGVYSRYIEIGLLAIVIFGLMLFRSNRRYLLFFICLLLAIVLSSFIPSFYPINVLYFKYFGMFRGVSRMILPSALFLGLLIGMVIQLLSKRSSSFSRKKSVVYLAGYTVLVVVVLFLGMNNDATWKRNTDFSKLAKLYEPIKTNDNIKVIATYPMISNHIIAGCPQGHQLLGQIIHNKSFACGASPFSKEALAYYASISDITEKNTISILTKYNIDTIFISNKLIKGARDVNAMLKNDTRLQFIGHYMQPYDKGNISTNDLSRDINVYQIKTVVEKNKSPQPLFNADGNSKIVGYKQIDPYRYTIHMRGTGETSLSFDAPYSEKWLLLPGDLSTKNDLELFGAVSPYSHSRFNEYANVWKIPQTWNTSGEAYFMIYFAPRSIGYAADKIGVMTYAISLGIILFSYLKMVYITVRDKAKNNL